MFLVWVINSEKTVKNFWRDLIKLGEWAMQWQKKFNVTNKCITGITLALRNPHRGP